MRALWSSGKQLRRHSYDTCQKHQDILQSVSFIHLLYSVVILVNSTTNVKDRSLLLVNTSTPIFNSVAIIETPPWKR